MTINSNRRDPTESEFRSIVNIDGGCAGFFVANENSDFLVATARHCVEFEATKKCEAGEIFVNFEASPSDAPTLAVPSAVGICKEIVAGTSKDDLFIMKVEFFDLDKSYQATDDFTKLLRNSIQFLKLASYIVPSRSRITMLGFPADINRNSKPTVTENCWDTSSEGITYFSGERTALLGGNASNGSEDPRARPFLRLLQRKLRWHNCSTWGGNSGGPMILEDTQDVIGIPGVYDHKMDQTKVYSDVTTSGFYETTAGFVERNRAALERAGVTISTSPPADVLQGHRTKTERWIRAFRQLRR